MAYEDHFKKKEKTMSDLGRLLFEQANAQAEALQLGMENERIHTAILLRPLFSAYDRAVLDPDAKIPTRLHLAIEQLREKYAPRGSAP